MNLDLELGLDVHDVVVGEDREGLINRVHRSENFSETLGAELLLAAWQSLRFDHQKMWET